MDLTAYGAITIVLEFDPNTSFVTMTFKDESEVVTIGSITIEQNRYRAFVEALGLTGKVYFDDLHPNSVGFKAAVNKNTNKIKVSFG